MVMFKTRFETIPASEEEINQYYEAVAKKINLLFEKYDIRNIKGDIEKVSAENLQTHLTFAGFFQPTPLKSIFFGQKQQFIPKEIILAYRSILSDAPLNIKTIFFNKFITLLTEKGWSEALSKFLVEQYHVPPECIIILQDLKDFSLGSGVYRVTLDLRDSRRRKIDLFLKRSQDLRACNEQFYFHLQRELLSTARYAPMPHRLSGRQNKEELLLSPTAPGLPSDIVLSLIMKSNKCNSNSEYTFYFNQIIEVCIEAFIEHAVLGDLLGRNDRHLMNSLTTFVFNNIPQEDATEDLSTPEKVVALVKNIVIAKTTTLSVIDIDLKWLVNEENDDWALVDIDFGLSELNLLSLLPEFNDYNAKTNPFFEKRRHYVEYYYKLYCQKLETLLAKKETMFSALKTYYPNTVLYEKLKLLSQKIFSLERSKIPIIKLFERYLLNYRSRLVYKETLIRLYRLAIDKNDKTLLETLITSGLLKYLPPSQLTSPDESSVFTQLQCFRGVLSQNDSNILCSNNKDSWESIACNISMIAKQFSSELLNALQGKIKFIENDTTALLQLAFAHESASLSIT